MHCFTLCFFIQQFILESFSFSTQRAYNQKSSGSGKPRAQQMRAVYQRRLSGGSWAHASCQNSSPVSTLACVLLLRNTVSAPKHALPREPADSVDPAYSVTTWRSGPGEQKGLIQSQSGHRQNWSLLVFCILAPSPLHCTTYVTNS